MVHYHQWINAGRISPFLGDAGEAEAWCWERDHLEYFGLTTDLTTDIEAINYINRHASQLEHLLPGDKYKKYPIVPEITETVGR